VSREVLKRLLHAFVNAHLDYYNSILARIPDAVVQKFQILQNSAAYLVTKTGQ